ncbi:hypothetical protein Tco_0126516 [Tanacetum coccineum]
MFILPVSIANDVERPKVEGGLGIRSLEDWNIALVSKHIWNLITFKDSLWVKWVHAYKLKGRSFWDINDKGASSWSWKKILKIKGLIRDHIIHRIGDGMNTSLWFDNWHPICPLSNFISSSKIYYAGLSLKTNVADVVDNRRWIWPKSLSNEFDGITAIDPLTLINGKNDKIL